MRILYAALALAMLAALAFALPAWTMAPKEAQAMEMDFSHVTSRAQAQALARRGELTKILYFPKRFGGENVKENTGYVPPGTQVALDFAHDRISGLIDLKSINRMIVEPKYRGKSVVPSAIVYICSGEGEGTITMTINIW
ncbi:hypothetical protein [Blastomonas sp. AAP53]|uniref:hypothetical protein n=1 Tax=Blastomonas sp. AAP53 TaxID=1248760 RepID=UPI000377475E|nr:hypothetical protein [Blastomonas sp. AAP53]